MCLGHFIYTHPYTGQAVELTLSNTVTRTRTCSTFNFSSSIFSRNGRIETIQAVIATDNRRVTLDRFQAEIALFDGNGDKFHDRMVSLSLLSNCS